MKHLYQFVQVELKDGAVYQGILHSYDKEKMYLIMPNMHHPSMKLESMDESRIFPFFGPFGLFGFPIFGIPFFI
ncbi:hypothetical protein [Bacillus sp. FJAT-27445]|uniref:hypothetical protein n=1 Tax=Bacillus sp. FJAT-27445 TaxID=1679166 RepID=UPI00074440AF|nr:hypothetical protein [Bacillus sp. FJAT-27445]